MNHLVSDSVLRAVEQGILGLLLGLGAACLLVFVLRWRAVGPTSASVKPWRDKLEKSLDGISPSRPAPTDGGLGEAGAAERLAGVGLAVVLYNLLKVRICASMDALREVRALLLARRLQSPVKETF